MDIEFTREENGTRYIYRLSPGDQGITGPWKGEITVWSPGASAPSTEVLTLVPDPQHSRNAGRGGVAIWNTPDGRTQWAVGPDGRGSEALTERYDGQVQWSAGIGG